MVETRRTAVLIPSRNRPGQLEEAIQSVMDTSTLADVLVYIDDDQQELYDSVEGLELWGHGERVFFHHGPRVDTVASLNELVRLHPEYSAYGVMTDNSVMVDKGWDVFLQETLDLFPGRLGVISPWHNCGMHVDQPFVSREWVELVGWYACPDFKHYAWPLVTGIIGAQTGIYYSHKGEFSIQHDYVGGYWESVYVADCKALYACIASTVIYKVDVIQRAMRGVEQVPVSIPRTMGVQT
jgi:hypothetical protein